MISPVLKSHVTFVYIMALVNRCPLSFEVFKIFSDS